MTASVKPPVVPDRARGRVPDFFIVGHAKSGTTALYEMLRRRPEIYMPDLKETRFFAPDLKEARSFAIEPNTLEAYLALFAQAKAGQRVGEASPQYIRSPSAAALIAEVQPDARIIAILREPASFLHSLHLQLLQAHIETEKDFGRALACEQARRTKREDGTASVQQGLMYMEHVRYVEQLRRFHDVFGREQVLVLIYDDFRADNEATVRRVLRFLDVDDRSPIEVTEANPSVRVRSPRMYELVRSLYLGRGGAARALKAPITALTPQRLRHGGLTLVRRAQWSRPGAPDEELMLELRRRFKPEVVALSEYLGRDLVRLWGYDNLA
jgi:Sulfotransferase family